MTTAHGGCSPIRDVLRMAANARLVPMVFDTDGHRSGLVERTARVQAPTAPAHHSWTRAACIPAAMSRVRCEVMHVHDWVKGGPTNIDNLALGCDYHHHRFGKWTLQRRNGRVWCTPPMWVDPFSDRESIPYSTTPTYSRHLIDDYSATAFWVSSESICSDV